MSDISNLVPDLKDFVGEFRKKSYIGKIVREGARLIKRRTRIAGKDINDVAFRVLEDSTKKIKKRNRKSTKSRLTDTKEMLDAIRGKALKNGEGLIFFTSDEMADRAKWNEEGNKAKNRFPRVFFGFSPKDERKLSNFIRDLYRKITNTGV